MKKLLAVLTCAILTGCASAPNPSADQVTDAATRVVPVTPEQFSHAATAVFNRSRPGEYEIQSRDGLLIADHSWRHLGVLGFEAGSDTWEIRYALASGGTRVTLNETNRYGGLLIKMPLKPIDAIGDYNLFWARLDNALGRRSDWVTCQRYRTEIRDPRAPETAIEDLCGSGSPN